MRQRYLFQQLDAQINVWTYNAQRDLQECQKHDFGQILQYMRRGTIAKVANNRSKSERQMRGGSTIKSIKSSKATDHRDDVTSKEKGKAYRVSFRQIVLSAGKIQIHCILCPGPRCEYMLLDQSRNIEQAQKGSHTQFGNHQGMHGPQKFPLIWSDGR
eukprot:scaffold121292_cov24-Attheya_sp.AAC.1